MALVLLRLLLLAPAWLPLQQESGKVDRGGSMVAVAGSENILIAYLSRTENTKALAIVTWLTSRKLDI